MKLTIKTLALLLVAALFFSSCSSSSTNGDIQKARIAEFERDDYTLLNQVTGESKTTKVWFLFIPFAGKNEARMRELAYEDALAQIPGADGILKPRYQFKKTVIPAIILGVSLQRVTVVGRGYKLKSDSDLIKEKMRNNP